MDKNSEFAVIGGDARFAWLAGLLFEDGKKVTAFALDRAEIRSGVKVCMDLDDALSGADYVILPLPVTGSRDMLNAPLSSAQLRVEEVLDKLTPSQIVFAGKADERLHAAARERGLRLLDYYEREELAVYNAAVTAEGAAELILHETPMALYSSRCLVIGFGRIGKILANRLRALGAEVSVSSRKASDMAWCRALGYEALDTLRLEGELGAFDTVINTVPAPVLGEKLLRELRSCRLCLDLASRPGGIDLTAAAKLGIKAVWALSLPGGAAPLTAGAAIMNTVYNMIREGEGTL